MENTMPGYQIIVTNIKYKGDFMGKPKDRPETVILDVPENILKTKKNDALFKDGVETFAYNTVSKKAGCEVTSCQVWLPLED